MVSTLINHILVDISPTSKEKYDAMYGLLLERVFRLLGKMMCKALEVLMVLREGLMIGAGGWFKQSGSLVGWQRPHGGLCAGNLPL
jgi:hypothetical protein